MSRLGSEGEDIIGKWSEDKLDLLAKYLKAYSIIMNKQKTPNNTRGIAWLQAYYYIDAFAGSITPKSKEDEQRYIKGSPLRALQTEPKFDGYWFIDLSPRRIERVERLREEFSNCTIEIRQGNCNEVLRNEIIPQLLSASNKRAFVFLDPYGLQVDWDTVKQLAHTQTCDIFINFSVMGVTRLLPKDRSPSSEVVERLNKVMGSTDWLDKIYWEPEVTQLNLFGNQEYYSLSRDTIPAEWFASLYAEKLGSIFRYVSRPILMRNSTNSALYTLCMASHNQTAIKIMNDIFKRHEKLR